jgi:L-fuconolactonase
MAWELPNKNVLPMIRIDSHQHFWKYDPVRDGWITNAMAVIQKDFSPNDLQPVLQQNGFEGCVVVQSDQSEAENEFQLANAANHDFIKGVVGWVDLMAPSLEEKLKYYSGFKKMKGFRHVLQGEKNRAFMLQPQFIKGIGLLAKYNFTYDILIFPDQLKHTIDLVKAFPGQPFVIDHIAKPAIKDKEIGEWKKDIEAIAKYENVSCKISGMVTEADWRQWKKADLTPYIDVITNAFGAKRILYGSDWPVCLVAAPYEQVVEIVKDHFSSFSRNEQELFFGGNAINFYNLN